jgi:exodeoxyribonuclease V gamma subunit
LQQDSDTEEKSIHLRLKEFVLTGRLTGLTTQGQLKIRFAKCRAADIVNAWICHLAYCLAAGSQRPLATSLVCSDTAVQFDAARHPQSYLLALLELYWKGLMSPLPFFPETAAVFVKQLLVRGQTRSRALTAARRQWEGNLYQRGERDDEYSSLCFSHRDPLDEVFESVSQTVFAPIAAHSQEMVLAAANWPVPSSD